MEEVITEEWLMYQNGFQDAIAEIMAERYFDGIGNVLEGAYAQGWYFFGYEDCYSFLESYSNDIDDFILEFLLDEEWNYKIMKDGFIQRVVEFNRRRQTKIPFAMFKLKRR